MESIERLSAQISDIVWGPPLLILLFGTHLFLTVRLRFIQRHLVTAIRISSSRKREGIGDVSQLGALTTAPAATIGTGNIVGVATAGAVISALTAIVILGGIRSIVKSAFSGHAALGGFLGVSMKEAVRYGIARGLFPRNAVSRARMESICFVGDRSDSSSLYTVWRIFSSRTRLP
jgi:Na+/alanine symporter